MEGGVCVNYLFLQVTVQALTALTKRAYPYLPP